MYEFLAREAPNPEHLVIQMVREWGDTLVARQRYYTEHDKNSDMLERHLPLDRLAKWVRFRQLSPQSSTPEQITMAQQIEEILQEVRPHLLPAVVELIEKGYAQGASLAATLGAYGLHFPAIDTSYWKVKDSEWMAARKAAWPRIEKMLYTSKSGKGKTAIKNYFLKGKLPDWEAFANWDNYERHVDLFILLWLHPFWDEALLTTLRNTYMDSYCIVADDLRAGYGQFLSTGITMASQDYSGNSEEEMGYLIDTQGHNELLFRVMMGDLEQTQVELVRYDRLGMSQPPYEMPKRDIDSLYGMGRWLCIKKMHPVNNDMLFQYDLPLEWWYRGCPSNEKYFGKVVKRSASLATEEALWRIHHFDDVAKGPGPRTTFVTKMRKMLDERPFIGEIKEMWQRVKSGEIQLDDPWNPMR